MAFFVLVPGAGGAASYWHRLVPELRRRGHEAVAVDLPADDDAAGLDDYADRIFASGHGRTGVVVVAQSLAALSAPLAVDRLDAALLVLLNAMTPRPGETGAQWWEATGQPTAQREAAVRSGRLRPGDPGEDEAAVFLHHVPDDVLPPAPPRGQSARPFQDPWPLPGWPAVPTRFLQARQDRLFPLEFQRRVVGERLGLEVDEIDGGHLVALSRPAELADRLDAYLATLPEH